MSANIPLPALDVQQPQQQNPMQGFRDFLAMRAANNQAALANAELTGEQQKNQAQAIALEQSKKQLELAPQFVTKDETGKVTGFDNDGYFTALMGSGAMKPQDVYAAKATIADATKKIADAGSAQIELQDKKIGQASDLLEGIRALAKQPGVTPQQLQDAYTTAVPKVKGLGFDVSKFPAAYPGDAGLVQFETGLGATRQMLANAKEIAATNESTAKASNEEAQAALNNIKVKIAQNAKAGDLDPLIDKLGLAPSMASYVKQRANFALTRGDYEGAQKVVDQMAGQVAQTQQDVARETNPAVIAAKKDVAKSEAAARMAIEGMAKPVYAYDPKTNVKSLMSQSDAIAQGIKTMTPVTAKEVSDDTMLQNRLGDVYQKLGEYERALEKPVTDKDRGNIAGLLGGGLRAFLHTGGLMTGGAALEIPMDRVNAALDKENTAGLSDAAREQLVAYRNMREAMIGYKTVLSGSARGSDKQLDILETLVPNPAITDQKFSQESLDKFRGNLGVVTQGMPRIPGVQHPSEWEKGNQGEQPAANARPAVPSSGWPAGATHTGVGSKDKKLHYLSGDGKDLGLVPGQS